MKNVSAAAVLLMLAVLFTTSVLSQKPKSKDDSFNEIAALTKSKKPEEVEKAYQLSRDFLVRFGKDSDDKVTKIKTFMVKYRENLFFKAVDGNKYANAFSLGKEILAEQPDNAEILLNLAYAGYNAFGTSGDKTYSDDSVAYARKAIQLIDAGNMPKSFDPFKDKNQAIAFMYYVDGNLSLGKDAKAAIGSIYKSVQYESSIKNSSLSYSLFASYYEDIYAKLSTDFKAKLDAKTISDADIKTTSEKIEKAIDLMMDAYARAVKLGETDKNPDLPKWKERLTQIYKFVKKSETGLSEYISQVNTTLMPDPAKF